MKPHILTALALCALTVVARAASSVPEQINYQGQLLNNAGAPLTAGDHIIEIRLFDQPASGVAVWGPQIFDGTNATGHSPQVAVDTNGRFSVKIGPTDTTGRNLSEIATNASLYVELKVGTNSPIFPRQQVLSTPFAFRAHQSVYASKADGLFTVTNISTTGLNINSKSMFVKRTISPGTLITIAPGYATVPHGINTSDYDVFVVGWRANLTSFPVMGCTVEGANGLMYFGGQSTGSAVVTMEFLGIRKTLTQFQ